MRTARDVARWMQRFSSRVYTSIVKEQYSTSHAKLNDGNERRRDDAVSSFASIFRFLFHRTSISMRFSADGICLCGDAHGSLMIIRPYLVFRIVIGLESRSHRERLFAMAYFQE
jgi:hypothetical protein